MVFHARPATLCFVTHFAYFFYLLSSEEATPVKPLSPAEKVQIEREQEQKLKSKYPQGAARPMPAAPGGKDYHTQICNLLMNAKSGRGAKVPDY